jgi:hypothetical protein
MTWSAGYSRNSHLYEVYLNGVREPLARKADVEWGWIERMRTDRDGNIVQDAATGRPILDRIHGEVELRKCNQPEW